MAEREPLNGSFGGALWSANDTPVRLSAGGTILVAAYGINALGQVVGPGACAEQGTACLWEAGGVTDLGSLDYGGYSEPLAINNHGDVVGWAQAWPHGLDHAVLWRSGLATDLGTLGGTQSQALDIENSGRIVGWARPAGEDGVVPPRHAFLWENGTMTDLGTLGGAESIAFAINDSGQVVGWLGDFDNKRAFVWQGGTMNLLSPGSDYSQALDINSRGDIVGTYIVSGTTHHAALWRDGVRYDLNEMVADPRLCLNWANAINDTGQIVGVGAWKSDGREFGFLLTPTGTW